MSNPARELHSVYAGWRGANPQGNKAMHQIVNPTDDAGWPQVASVTRLLVRIDELLTYFESEGLSVAVYRRQYPGWWAPVLAFPYGWNTNVRAEAMVGRAVLDQIEAFASFLDGKVYSLSSAGEQTLRTVLTRARSLLEDDESLDVELRSYIHRLLQMIQNALDDDKVGVGTDMAEEVRKLWVALRAAEGASEKKGPAWREIWTQIATATSAGALVEGGSVLIRSLTSGL